MTTTTKPDSMPNGGFQSVLQQLGQLSELVGAIQRQLSEALARMAGQEADVASIRATLSAIVPRGELEQRFASNERRLTDLENNKRESQPELRGWLALIFTVAAVLISLTCSGLGIAVSVVLSLVHHP